MSCYLDTKDKKSCFGCESCANACVKSAIAMVADADGFRYPEIDKSSCVDCGACRKACPSINMPIRFGDGKYVFGGYHKDYDVRFESTSGGAFSAVVEAFCDANYVIFGAESRGLQVFHTYITDKSEIYKFRKSKYVQSVMGSSYVDAKKFLLDGKKVLFSGTPCQIAGLKAFLDNVCQDNLLTVEVVCEGVPSPLYINKYEKHLSAKYGRKVKSIDYRYTGRSIFTKGKWDFEQMKICFEGSDETIVKDRWFNPFWSVWLQHLMSRPSCYECPFACLDRVADITLGDLWGVHKYCPELYGHNVGSSLVVCNTEKAKSVFNIAQKFMYGHELNLAEAIKYQGPMRRHLPDNPHRSDAMADLRSNMDYKSINRKWAHRPTLNLLLQKYIWGNRQKVFIKTIFK